MKALKTLIAIALSAGGLGTAVTLGALSNKNNDFKAVAAESSSRVYLDCSGHTEYDDAQSIALHYWSSDETTINTYRQATKAGDNYWYIDLDLTGVAKYQWLRCDAAAGPNSNDHRYNFQYETNVSDNNYYKVTGWNNSGTWHKIDRTWTIVGSTGGEAAWNGGNEDISISLTERFNAEGLEFINTSVSLAAGSVFKIKNSAGSYYGYDCIQTGDGSVISTGDVSGEGNSNITVVNSGSYEIYMKPTLSQFWMQENSEATATSWANSFLTATGTICSDGGESADHLTALQGIWTTQKNAYDALTEGARNIIKTGTASNTIKDAHDRYIHIMTRYAGELASFKEWNVSSSNRINPVAENNSAVLIAAVASAIVLTTTGLFFLLRRKRKEQ